MLNNQKLEMNTSIPERCVFSEFLFQLGFRTECFNIEIHNFTVVLNIFSTSLNIFTSTYKYFFRMIIICGLKYAFFFRRQFFMSTGIHMSQEF